MAANVADHLSAEGAKALAERVADYWRGQGFRVAVWIEKQAVPRRDLTGMSVVRSDLVNAVPRGYRGELTVDTI